VSMPFGEFFGKPVAAVAVMSLAVYGSYHYTEPVLSGNKATLLSILVGVVVYAIVLLATGAVRRQDFEMLPGGRKLSRILTRLKLIRN